MPARSELWNRICSGPMLIIHMDAQVPADQMEGFAMGNADVISLVLFEEGSVNQQHISAFKS